ncbi:GNAT family N-acetyltransferase [Marivita sp.]|uniref:GNAT family N-acetyltransferase n=1 Tax=Marivita sp. TaxID=2003365 RepID=UPI0025C43B46|nr:GNAT family N-acetyltransferase [Marivita sp.]
MPAEPLVHLRPATAEDLPALKLCARAAYARYVPVIGREPAPMVADFARPIADGSVCVATCDAGLAGFILFYPQDDAMLLENVAVHPVFAGHGIGGRLIALCEDKARELGLGRVRLYTNAAMAANLTLYPRLGYRVTGRRTEDGFDRVYFEKPV